VELAGAVVVVTGASRGVGRAVAVALGAAGATVVCVARATDASPLRLPGTVDDTAQAVDAAGGRGVARSADLSVPTTAAEVVAEAAARFGRLDAVVNNAAITFPGDLALPLRRYELMMAVNVTAPLLATVAAAEHLGPGGAIVNVSSRASLEWFPGMTAYGMGKAALEHLTVSSAAVLAPRGIAVNGFRIDVAVASEGFVDGSPGVDTSTWLPPAVAAEGIVWMLRQPPSYTGHLESMRDLAEREGIMAAATSRPRSGPGPTSLSRARGEVDARY
jgi:citronellol/citronellal dehydrogenase